mgnify:CR=1 FL=1
MDEHFSKESQVERRGRMDGWEDGNGWRWCGRGVSWMMTVQKKKNVPSFVSTGTVSFWGGATQMPVVLKRKNTNYAKAAFPRLR